MGDMLEVALVMAGEKKPQLFIYAQFDQLVMIRTQEWLGGGCVNWKVWWCWKVVMVVTVKELVVAIIGWWRAWLQILRHFSFPQTLFRASHFCYGIHPLLHKCSSPFGNKCLIFGLFNITYSLSFLFTESRRPKFDFFFRRITGPSAESAARVEGVGRWWWLEGGWKVVRRQRWCWELVGDIWWCFFESCGGGFKFVIVISRRLVTE